MKKVFHFIGLYIFTVFKFILFIPYKIVCWFVRGFQALSLFLSRGFYFYFKKFFEWMKKLLPISSLDKVIHYFQVRQEQPSHIVMVIVWFLAGLYLFDTFYVAPVDTAQFRFEEVPVISSDTTPASSDVASTSEENILFSKEMNLYRIYGKYSLGDINFEDLRNKNADTVAWIMVEGTNINYPIVQTDNNDYYLNHSYDYSYSVNGWTFMDYRNSSNMQDSNTVFYGHNLLNKTSFGSIDKLFKNKQSDIKIRVLTADRQIFTYQVFSAYYIDPEIYYIQTSFYNLDEYQQFLNTIAGRNIIEVDNTVTISDKIITLSTCTDDNKGRKVVHAKLISASTY